ncbi:MAG: fibronectin type III domain-containing protein [Lachnospira eligens]
MKIGGHAADALRLNWTKNSKASGYIVEQYKGGKWTRIARIGENSTTTYRVEKLSASTTYKFRVQAFGFDGKTALYGNYAYINGKTSPATVTGIRIGGTAKDALRVNWNKDSKASGYIVQQYKNGTWVRIARIGNNNTTTYRVSGLKSGSTYIFRVQAFGYDGKTAIYGGFAMIPGTTK